MIFETTYLAQMVLNLASLRNDVDSILKRDILIIYVEIIKSPISKKNDDFF
jgi:hypothetical protein